LKTQTLVQALQLRYPDYFRTL
ncbi:MAG: hypothetical protein K0Q80_211, partial [Microvirga sp.]|nr:hypothetical protein [Microvirga sp.]